MQSYIFIYPKSISVLVYCNQLKFKIFRTKQSLLFNIYTLSKGFFFQGSKSSNHFYDSIHYLVSKSHQIYLWNVFLHVSSPLTYAAFIWATALISSFLDHRSSYLSALPDPKLSPLQTHVHATARLIFFKCHFHLVTVCWEALNSPLITSASWRWPWSLSHLTPHFIDEETEVQWE